MAKRRVLVTGVSRWWGALTVQRLVEHPEVGEVIGIDTAEPHHDLGDADFLRVDIRHSLIGKLVRAAGVDTVIHTQTTIDSFDQDPRRAHEVNVIGTINLLAGLAGDDTPVRRVVLKSSAHVYGASYRNPGQLGEEHPLDANSPHSFVRDIIEAEANLFDLGVRHPRISVAALRLTNTLNPEEQAPLARHLDLPVVPTFAGFDPVLQLIHRDDAVDALVAAALAAAGGAFNVAATNPLPLSSLLREAGKLSAPLLPPAGYGALALVLRRMGLPTLSPQLVDLLRYGRTLALDRARTELGFVAARDTLAAFEEFMRDRRVSAYQPAAHAYVFDRELEDYIRRRRERRRRSSTLQVRGAGEPEPEPAPRSGPRRPRRPRPSAR